MSITQRQLELVTCNSESQVACAIAAPVHITFAATSTLIRVYRVSKPRPTDSALQTSTEVTIANQDIGFVNASQAAEIKLETFSFTKYGTVKATVDNVSADAVTDEKRGEFLPGHPDLAEEGHAD